MAYSKDVFLFYQDGLKLGLSLTGSTKELEDVGYVESRREMARRLREIMNLIQGVKDLKNIQIEQLALD
jgi:hypothetical protein